MSLPNFDNQLSQRVELCGPLKELISAFYMLEPTVKFVANNRSRRYNEGSLLDGERPIGSVHAYKDSQHLGYIRVFREDYRGLGRMDVYYIGSERVNKARGRNRMEVTTKDSHKAIKLMHEYFKPKANFSFRDKIISECTNKLSSMTSTAKYRANSLISRHDAEMTLYLLAKHEGLTPDLPLAIQKVFASSENIQKFHDLRIANGIEKNYYESNGAVVATFSDGTIWFADLTKDESGERPQIVKLQTTYDLPQNYQEKLALLKLCENSQPVEHVGVKYSDEIEQDSNAMLYYLIGGDTVTTC